MACVLFLILVRFVKSGGFSVSARSIFFYVRCQCSVCLCVAVIIPTMLQVSDHINKPKFISHLCDWIGTVTLLNWDPALHLHLSSWRKCYGCSVHFLQSATKKSSWIVECYWMCMCRVFLTPLVNCGAVFLGLLYLAAGCCHANCQHELCLFEPWVVVVV